MLSGYPLSPKILQVIFNKWNSWCAKPKGYCLIINASGGYHGYWQQDIYTINPHFGTSNDLQHLIAACHSKGIWVTIDTVCGFIETGDGWCSWKPRGSRRLHLFFYLAFQSSELLSHLQFLSFRLQYPRLEQSTTGWDLQVGRSSR